MKKKYMKRVAAISVELRKIREMCDSLDKDMDNDTNPHDSDDDQYYVNYSDGCVFLDDAVGCFIGFEPQKRTKKARTTKVQK